MTLPAEDFWPSCLARFAEELSAQQFNTWIKPLACSVENEAVSLYAPNQFSLQFVKDRFLVRIEKYAAEYFGELAHTIELTVGKAQTARPAAASTSSNSAGRNETAAPQAQATTAKPTPLRSLAMANETTRLNPNFTFETLVTGKANQLARAAAIQIGENPGTAYNPLFVYGGVGLGKTHLIQAIGNLVHQHRPDAKIRYIHAERYVADVVRAYQHKSFDEFKRYYHSLDLLLIDDIQFFSGKNRTQEEFFYAFNALIEGHRQVIITSDRYPKEIEGIEDRLISRFGWGLTVAIEPPELEMRVAILHKKAESEGFKLESSVSFFIAKHIRSNVRELEGALKRVLAYSRFTGEQITLEVAKEALKDILASGNKLISVENIQKTVADFYKIKVADMHSKKRTRDIARPRQIAMALAKDLTQMSLPAIGEAFGGRDHTTVLHACKTIAALRQGDATMNHDYNVLAQILRN
ncbi:chromosomal replication initiator protein DnaA [Chitinimonas viridis]|uniref:Chromosomal replication initiator protein DnaA n=2 Tax=Chitinimonas TaxID=240411 RepID=A0ABT8B8R9_9NEIS|nr:MULTISPECIES: chromosomal replication initiator protein DnaA [Chitinimonas]MDN3578523.1 chromosomal replication initiator protein DnaA [Chitinimonas viridis]GLR12421.1 chromosomal replication initiator protein DnaA [Chitinimonas prasina]